MNTPAHAVLSFVALGTGRSPFHWLPLLAGALVPDLPMIGFYAYQRLVQNVSENKIWSQLYFEANWQSFFDTFNSFPLIALGFALASSRKNRTWMAFFASMALHCVADLLLHHDDGHRHFFPLSSWRFSSPVSYWDPMHFGHIVSLVEVAVVLLGCTHLLGRSKPNGLRLTAACVGVVYLAFIGFALSHWVSA